MLRILWNSKSAMIANQEKLDAISNNLANVNTDGYKKVEVGFQDLLSETLERKGYPTSEGGAGKNTPFTGTGVKTSPWIRDDSQGNMIATNKTTDFGIDGEGYFKVEKPDGSNAYIRAGKFDIDKLGRLVDPNGNKLVIQYNDGVDAKNIKFTKDNFSINQKGDLVYKENDQQKVIGRIPIYSAQGKDAFRSIGENLYQTEPGVNVYEVTDSPIMQGFLESSNVDMVSEMSDMMLTQRAFELGSRGIKTADDMWGMVNNLRGK